MKCVPTVKRLTLRDTLSSRALDAKKNANNWLTNQDTSEPEQRMEKMIASIKHQKDGHKFNKETILSNEKGEIERQKEKYSNSPTVLMATGDGCSKTYEGIWEV